MTDTLADIIAAAGEAGRGRALAARGEPGR